MEKLTDIEKNEIVNYLIDILCIENEVKIESFSLEKKSYEEKKRILDSLLITWKPKPLPFNFLKYQNLLLESELSQKKLTLPNKLDYYNNMSIFFGDITTLKVDAIVCACESGLVGTFNPNENTIYNKILTSGGLQIKQDLSFLMSKQKEKEPNGTSKIIKGYNLPAKYVICTVAPTIFSGRVGYREKEELINCYKSCLDTAYSKGLETIAFSCIGTGKKNYPKALASEIAVSTTFSWLKANKFPLKVIFCVHNEENKLDYEVSFSDYDVK